MASLSVLLALRAAPAATAVIDDAGGPALVTGPDGLGLFAYHDRANGDLKVAHCVDAACTAVTTVSVDSAGDVGRKVSLVMGPNGPIVAYEDTTNGALKLALCGNPLCTTSATAVIASDFSGSNTAVALAADGRPLVAFVAGGASARLKAAHCDDASCATLTISDLDSAASSEIGLVIGGDGRGMIHYTRLLSSGQPIPGALLHCADVACTAGSVAQGSSSTVRDVARPALLGPAIGYPSMRVGADGFIRVAVAYQYLEGSSVKLVRCLDAACALNNVGTIPAQYAPPALALGADGLPLLVVTAAQPTTELRMVHCLDADCAAQEPQVCLAGMGKRPTLALDTGGAPLVAFDRGDNLEVLRPPVTCAPMMGAEDSGLLERTDPTPAGQMRFVVGFAPASPATVQVSYQTVDGTAQGGVDYLPVSGTLTFGPGQPLYQYVDVTVVPDAVHEPDETLELVLSAPVNVTIADGRALGVIFDDDAPPLPQVSAGDCTRVEGDSGTTGCVFDVVLSDPAGQTVTVAYQTADGAATAGADYVSSAGVLTFAPATVTRTVSVSVVGDTAVELDETFFMNLSSPVNATIGDGVGTGTIVDDDAPSLSTLELTHGSRLTADLAASGPVPDQDFYRLAQGPYSSWEVVADEVSGDIAPGLQLQLLAEDNSTVEWNSIAVGTGSARALRWEHRAATPEVRPHVRVQSASCTSGCGPDDTYRLRVYETTGVIPRFNNSGSQIALLILQNTTDKTVAANADFWDAGGVLRATVPFLLSPRSAAVLNTSTLPELAGLSGSISVTHSAGYGRILGKAVALEPSTGFSFDSPMVSKPR